MDALEYERRRAELALGQEPSREKVIAILLITFAALAVLAGVFIFL